MDLLSDGTRLSMLRRIISSPTHSVVMAALMAGVMMAMAMMMMR